MYHKRNAIYLYISNKQHFRWFRAYNIFERGSYILNNRYIVLYVEATLSQSSWKSVTLEGPLTEYCS